MSEPQMVNQLLASPLLQPLLEIASQASQLVLEVYEGAFEVEMKGPNDPVTEADRRANQLICDALRDCFPGCCVVAEESEPTVYGDYRRAEQVFFVDPVDGTREFVKHTGEFVVMLGCVQDELAHAGVIWAPTTGTRWIGERGLGAARAVGDGPFVAVSPSSEVQLALSQVLVSRAQGEDEARRLRELLGSTQLLPVGSAGLKGARVADGTADAYVTRHYAGKRWDACAPDALVSAAGGVFSDSTGKRIDYRSPDLTNRLGLVAANQRLHPMVIERLAVGL